MIELKQISKSFGEKKVLDGISLQIPSSQILFVLGKSGTGKSVLLKNMVGLQVLDQGEIWIDSEKVDTSNEDSLYRIRKKCGIVFQFPALLDSLSVFENIAFGIRAHELASNEKEVAALVSKYLGLVGLNESVLEKLPLELSFSMQKRVSVARTIAIEPKYLLFDEPTTGLDPILTHLLNDLILDLAKKLKVTCVVVSHDLRSAFDVADRIILLEQGKVLVDGNKEDFLKSEIPLVNSFLKESSL